MGWSRDWWLAKWTHSLTPIESYKGFHYFSQSSMVELKLSVCGQENLALIRYRISWSPSQQESTVIFQRHSTCCPFSISVTDHIFYHCVIKVFLAGRQITVSDALGLGSKSTDVTSVLQHKRLNPLKQSSNYTYHLLKYCTLTHKVYLRLCMAFRIKNNYFPQQHYLTDHSNGDREFIWGINYTFKYYLDKLHLQRVHLSEHRKKEHISLNITVSTITDTIVHVVKSAMKISGKSSAIKTACVGLENTHYTENCSKVSATTEL